MRWQAPDGQIWASRFEYAVFKTLLDKGYHVRKTKEQDRLAYTSPVRSARCQTCGSTACVTERTYTPDLFVGAGAAQGDARGYFIEAKGYLRADRRALLRAVRKAWPLLDLRLVVQRDYRVTASLTIVEWAKKYLKCKVHVWDGALPKDWT